MSAVKQGGRLSEGEESELEQNRNMRLVNSPLEFTKFSDCVTVEQVVPELLNLRRTSTSTLYYILLQPCAQTMFVPVCHGLRTDHQTLENNYN